MNHKSVDSSISPAKAAPQLNHLREDGSMHMVDVASKKPSHRVAVAEASLSLNKAAYKALYEGSSPKGDVWAAARLAGIMAAKKTSDLIPLCHNIPLTHVAIDFEKRDAGVTILATAESHGVTGVEMEAMTAASVSALCIYDMLKAVARDITIDKILLREKKGGKSGHWTRQASPMNK
jgi:cyclic pyranopterin monophosphate synthase